MENKIPSLLPISKELQLISWKQSYLVKSINPCAWSNLGSGEMPSSEDCFSSSPGLARHWWAPSAPFPPMKLGYGLFTGSFLPTRNTHDQPLFTPIKCWGHFLGHRYPMGLGTQLVAGTASSTGSQQPLQATSQADFLIGDSFPCMNKRDIVTNKYGEDVTEGKRPPRRPWHGSPWAPGLPLPREGSRLSPAPSRPSSPVVFGQMPKAEAKAHNMPIILASKPQMIVYSCWQMKPCSKHLIPNWINLRSPALCLPAPLPSCHLSSPLTDPVCSCGRARRLSLWFLVIHKGEKKKKKPAAA